jgi:hypothetical protein
MKLLLVLLGLMLVMLPLIADPVAPYMPGDQSLIFLPTAYTMPKGSFSLTNYELFFVQLTGAPTNSTHISVFSVVPFFNGATDTFSVGVKQNYLKTRYVQAAAWFSYTPTTPVFTLGNVVSIGKPQQSLHLGFANAFSKDEQLDSPIAFAGIRKDLSNKVAFITEFGTTFEEIGDNNKIVGVLSFGFRFKGDDIAWELGGVRPTGVDMGGVINFFPVVKATFEF